VLSAEEVRAIVERDLQERRDAAITHSSLGRHDEAATLRLQLEVLASFL
jgi:uncharacterized protein